MIYSEPGLPAREVGTGMAAPPGAMDATWRYIGDRTAADHAYCARFGVDQAPEPIVALGGAWAYALPSVEPLR